MRYLAACRRWAVLGLLFLPSAAFAVTDVNIQVTSHGDPLPGATVTLLDASGSRVVAEGEDDDNDGVVVFPDVAEGRYRVSVAAPDGAVTTTYVDVPAEGAVTVGVSAATGLGYNYLEFGYIHDFEFDEGGPFGSSLDGDGLWLQGSVGFNRYFFLRGDTVLVDLDVPGPVDVALDWLALGPGARLPLSIAGRPLDLWGQVSYDRIALGASTTGYGLATGVRFGATDRLELNGWYRQSETDEGDFELNPEMYGLGLVYWVSPAVALTGTYAEGELEIKQGGMTDRLDFDLVTFGLRLNYDAGPPAGALPTNANGFGVSYDYIQASYAFDGEIEEDSGQSEDIDQGLAFSGYRQVSDHVILGGSAWTFDIENPGGNNIAVDMYELGPGLRYGDRVGGTWVDVYGKVSYDRVSLVGELLDGYGLKLGVRVRPARLFEFGAWYKHSDTDVSDADLETALYGASFLIHPCDRLAFELGYGVADMELEQGGFSDDLELDYAFFGTRIHY